MTVEPESKDPFAYLRAGLESHGVSGMSADGYCEQLRMMVNRDFGEFVKGIEIMLAGSNRTVKAAEVFDLSGFSFCNFAKERADRILEKIDRLGGSGRW